MLSFRLGQLIQLVGALMLIGLLFTSVAAGSCEEEEQEGPKVLFILGGDSPTDLLLKKEGEENTVEVKNNGTKEFKIMGEGVAQIGDFAKVGKGCDGAELKPTKSCVLSIKCLKANKTGTYSFLVETPQTLFSLPLKCH